MLDDHGWQAVSGVGIGAGWSTDGRLKTVAPQTAQGRFHPFVELIEQIGQFIIFAAVPAAPLNFPSGSLKSHRRVAMGTNECMDIWSHNLLILNQN